MANPEIGNNDTSKVPVYSAKYDESAVINFAGADTYAAGTLMGQVLAVAGTAAAGGSNTGTGTISAYALVTNSEAQKIGNYLFTFTATLAGDLTDPDGNVLLKGVVLTQDDATVISAGGITFTITDATTAGTAFAADDTFTMPVEAGTFKYAPYATDGIGGLETIQGILTVEKIKAASGDLNGHVMIGGEVDKDNLIIDADGSSTTITASIIQELANVKDGIIVRDGTVLDELDNQ